MKFWTPYSKKKPKKHDAPDDFVGACWKYEGLWFKEFVHYKWKPESGMTMGHWCSLAKLPPLPPSRKPKP